MQVEFLKRKKSLDPNVTLLLGHHLISDETIEHLKGTKKMKEQAIYYGFSKEKQADYEFERGLIADYHEIIEFREYLIILIDTKKRTN